MGFIAKGIGDVVGSITGSNSQVKAAKKASAVQSQQAQQAIDFQKQQLAQARQYEQPYVDAGTGALNSFLSLIGQNGSGAQSSALGAVQSSPLLATLNQQGSDAILANAAATGGLRGGNTQDALAKQQTANYASVYQNLLSQLGGITSLGQNAATISGNNGLTGANAVSGLLGQQGQAQAGGIIAQGSKQSLAMNSLAQIAGTVIGAATGAGGFGGGGGLSGSAFDSAYNFSPWKPSAGVI